MQKKIITSTIRKYETPLILCAGLFIIVLATDLLDNNLLNRTVTSCLIRVVIVVGLYIFVGNSGIISFGHMGFMAIGAYAVAWQTCCPGLKPYTMPGLPELLLNNTLPNLPAGLAAGLLTAVIAFLVGIALMRLSGIAASIGTFAFLAIVNAVYSNWTSVTGGTSSISGIPLYVDIWNSLGWALVTILAAFVYQRSRYGLSLRATREDEIAAKSAGVNIFRQRLLAFTISAFFVGIGGVLYGGFLGILSPDAFYLNLTLITMAMLVVGGINSLSGAVSGVVVLSAFIEILLQIESGINVGARTISVPPGVQEIGLGILMLLILIFRNGGITGNREIVWPRKRYR
ncbi:MAG: branched-chain amino acid ABC transporter permease [bacterium]|nr:branched-chain amino acid ABC transporter permease [bacterium]